MGELRWRRADQGDDGQGRLFGDEGLLERHVGQGEFRDLEFIHVEARTIINQVPASSRLPFTHTINAYRGCSHACSYCLGGDTPILMADGRTRRLADIAVGDIVYGTERTGAYRRYVASTVLAHWRTIKPAYRVTLQDGTQLIASGDHRFLTERGWKYVTGTEWGPDQRPHLSVRNLLLGVGHLADAAKPTAAYQQGYLCGLLRGDGTLGTYRYGRRPRRDVVQRFRLALIDREPLERAHEYLLAAGAPTTFFVFSPEQPTRRRVDGIRTQRAASVEAIRALIDWPADPDDDWTRGFLAGIFDAEGTFSGSLRIANCSDEIIGRVVDSAARLGFRTVVETPDQPNNVRSVRLRGGLRDCLRFFLTTDPATTRKRTIHGIALESGAELGIVGIEPLRFEIPMYDITTTTGDFIADGVVSHNCFARPTHEYLGLNIGEDFERVIVVKVNAVEKLRAELAPSRWDGTPIAMGTNTDPYQRAEGKYHLTRGLIEVLTERANPFSILTKSTLILRDLDVLTAAAARTTVDTSLSIGTLDPDVWRLTEPGTPHPRQRVEAVARLNAAGVRCGVLIGPIIPGLSDSEHHLAEVTRACVAAGATWIGSVVLHLRPGVREHWMGWLAERRPDLVETYQRRYRGRAYLPKAEQQAVTATVQRLVAEARADFTVR